MQENIALREVLITNVRGDNLSVLLRRNRANLYTRDITYSYTSRYMSISGKDKGVA
jgi:hypothetical protein